MADTDTLTDARAQQLRDDLLTLKTELAQLIVALRDGSRPVDLDLAIGRLSRMDAMQQQKMSQASLAQAQLRLQQVGTALSAFDEGEYGECRRCEEPIGFARLQVRPESPFCLPCQSTAERKK